MTLLIAVSFCWLRLFVWEDLPIVIIDMDCLNNTVHGDGVRLEGDEVEVEE